MENRVQFDEEKDILAPIPRPRPVTMSTLLLRTGIAASPGHAAMLLALAASMLMIVSMYLLSTAVAPLPKLGNDVPRPGETIPSNRSI